MIKFYKVTAKNNQRKYIYIFFRITQYNADTHNVRTLTPMNSRTQTR